MVRKQQTGRRENRNNQESSDRDVKEFGSGERIEDGKSGWEYLTSFQSVNKMVDALLDLPPRKEFNKSELAELADVSRNSVGNHLERLVKLGIVEPVRGTSPTRYRLNPDSEVTELLIKLDGKLTRIIHNHD